MADLWLAHCQEMTKEFQKHTPHQIPHIMSNMIDLMDDDEDSCGDSILFWERWLARGSSPIAMLLLKDYSNSDDYFMKGYNQTARNRLRYSENKGYYCRIISTEERNERLDELHEINNSLESRQGLPMREESKKYPKKAEDSKNICNLHFNRLYGAFTADDKWVGYVSGVFCGELAAASQILGHGDYMKDDFMILLWFFFVKDIMENITNVKYVIYSLWLDGTEGLRTWKKSVGLRPIFPGNRKMVFGY